MNINTKKLSELIALGIVIGVAIFAAAGMEQKDPKTPVPDSSYLSITMEEAQEIFKTKGDYLILDVRRADEFASGHIPGAIHVANESISQEAPAELPDKEQTIYIYCRSGNRSKKASQKLAAMGYTNIIEFGGIIDWNGEIEK